MRFVMVKHGTAQITQGQPRLKADAHVRLRVKRCSLALQIA